MPLSATQIAGDLLISQASPAPILHRSQPKLTASPNLSHPYASHSTDSWHQSRPESVQPGNYKGNNATNHLPHQTAVLPRRADYPAA